MRPSLPRLIDLAAQLEQDAERAPEVLRLRDRSLGRELAQLGDDAEARLAAWLDRVRSPSVESPGERAGRSARVLTTLLVVGGALLGAAAAAALFHYDGQHPVNVVRVLGAFVGLQLLLLIATLVLCLPERWRGFVPGLAGFQDVLSLLSPGRWQTGLRLLLPESQREAADRLAGLARRHGRLYGDVQKWWLLVCSQAFGVAFNVAAIGVSLGLVAFTDLAFAWSTTLDADAQALVRVTRTLSLPYSWLWPTVAPSPELIVETQYYRAIEGHDPGVSAPWWRFLLACILLYGLAPRLFVLGFAYLRLQAAVRRAFARVPGVAALRDRLDSRLIETAAEGGESEGAGGGSFTASPAGTLAAGLRCRAVVWAGFPLADAAAASNALGVEVVALHRAGEASLALDAAALDALSAAGGEEPILVIARAWEPPVLELLDFVAELRERVGEGRPILVVPLGHGEDAQPTAPLERDAPQWHSAADRLGDPWTTVHIVTRSPVSGPKSAGGGA